MERKYLGESGLSKLVEQIKSLFVRNDDIITDEEIDEICGATIHNGDEVEL